jgi:hypothetical protein
MATLSCPCCFCGCCLLWLLQDLLAMLNASGSQHQFPMYASLLRHASSRRLALQDCAVVLGLAAEKVSCCSLEHANALFGHALPLACSSPEAWVSQSALPSMPTSKQHQQVYLWLPAGAFRTTYAVNLGIVWLWPSWTDALRLLPMVCRGQHWTSATA